jgi:hydroxyacylglutathione hydrolase
VLRALATPGHTPEHLAYLLLDGDRPIGVFTGGSLIVGGAARTDLVDPNLTEELARAQYTSLHRLLTLGDDVAVWPTHGAGSFCTAPGQVDRTSMIGRERAENPLLQTSSEDGFVDELLSSLGSFPPYFLRLADVNRRGPELITGEPELAPLDVATVRALHAEGAEIVDVRPIRQFAAGHIAGALSVPLGDIFATWLGWLVAAETPIVFVRDSGQDVAEIVWQALKIGIERLAGELTGGIAAWAAAQLPVHGIDVVGPSEVGARVLDVRQDSEFAHGHLPGATHIELGALRASVSELPPQGPLTVMCGHGERAMMAASLLARTGRRDLAVLEGGADDWARVSGRRLERAG